VALVAVLAALGAPRTAGAYCWPVRPFHKPHPIRGAFDDPRFHLGGEGALSSFHFGVDIVARDGTPVYAVAPGFVRRHGDSDVIVHRPNGRAFGYWHVLPIVHNGQHVRLHQLLGYVQPGWGHVHFAESMDGVYRNPLRKGALTPFRDRTKPTVASIRLLTPGGADVSSSHVIGEIDVEAEVYDTPPITPPVPWQVARLTPALIWWKLMRGTQALTDWNLVADFSFTLMPNALYNWVYAPGTYQNKGFRPGHYLFWITHELDTRYLPDGTYRLEVLAEDTRWNEGFGALDFTVANGEPPLLPVYAPGIETIYRRTV
jgi:murein DD-endopeptidase MepM/ murein hydrolase activator NlpD